jgi:hypothetical protein
MKLLVDQVLTGGVDLRRQCRALRVRGLGDHVFRLRLQHLRDPVEVGAARTGDLVEGAEIRQRAFGAFLHERVVSPEPLRLDDRMQGAQPYPPVAEADPFPELGTQVLLARDIVFVRDLGPVQEVVREPDDHVGREPGARPAAVAATELRVDRAPILPPPFGRDALVLDAAAAAPLLQPPADRAHPDPTA